MTGHPLNGGERSLVLIGGVLWQAIVHRKRPAADIYREVACLHLVPRSA